MENIGAQQNERTDLQVLVDALVQRELGNTSSSVNDAPIIKIIDAIINQAYHDKASDIHIEPEEEGVLIRFRIDSILYDMVHIHKHLHGSIVARIKVLSHLRTDEHLDAQDGKMKCKIADEDLDVRVSIIPTTEGEKVVMRLLTSRFHTFTLADLGMSQKDLDKIHLAIGKSDGLILSTGPTGSGKTTSNYAILKILNTREKNITTIEDPVEYRINGVNHIPVNIRSGFTFAKGLRSILRQDPNIIFVGEIRDQETANLAVNASLTGHLVLSTLHTNDAATAIPRLIDMQVEPFLLASTVNIIVAQRLVRKICIHCTVKKTITRASLRNQIPDTTWKKYFGTKTTIEVMVGKGCDVCHFTGYSGRVGLFEVLEVSEKIRKMIMGKKDSKSIRDEAIKEGMVPLLDDGLNKIREGITSLEELFRVIKIEKI